MKLMQPLTLLDTNIVLYFLGGKLVNPLPSGVEIADINEYNFTSRFN